MIKRISNILTGVVAMGALLVSCSPNPQSPGVEYMPDMYRSPAFEAFQRYDDNDSLNFMRRPVEGTIAHVGQAKMVYQMPYPYPKTVEGYEAAGTNYKSPIAITKAHMSKGQELFERFCIQCHGEAGAGNGSITLDGKYPVVPSYQSRQGLPEGKMFHTLTWGKGLMGSHASQLDKEERWQVIQYVKKLMYEVDEVKWDDKGNLIGNPFVVKAQASAEEETESTEG